MLYNVGNSILAFTPQVSLRNFVNLNHTLLVSIGDLKRRDQQEK